MKRTQFRIRTTTGPETVKGYVVGDFAAHKPRGDYFWTITHVPSGCAVTVFPTPGTVGEAQALLRRWHAEGPPQHTRDLIARYARTL